MVQWNSSPHPISDIRDWADDGKLIIQPSFQRREVWSLPAQILLMNTIINKIPMPKIFLSTELKDGKTLRSVIDGQQRITSILAFIRGEFSLDNSFTPDLNGRIFSDLPKQVRDEFLMYSIDFNEAQNASDEEIRNVYSRVNKYTIALNKQELRKADFPGDFLDLSESLALNEFLDDAKLFTMANRRRYGDVEFVSEILMAVIGKIQDKKGYLEEYYAHYATWNNEERTKIEKEFRETLFQIELLFGSGIELSKTRFRQKADFYSLFLAVLEFVRKPNTLDGKSLDALRADFVVLHEHIRPESKIGVLQDYAIKCVSQANSASSRNWRKQFLYSILSGTFCPEIMSDDQIEIYYRIRTDLDDLAKKFPSCCVCKTEIDDEEILLAWRLSDLSHQISNSVWIHAECAQKENYLSFPRPAVKEPDMFD